MSSRADLQNSRSNAISADSKLQLQLQIKQEYNDLVYPISEADYLELKAQFKLMANMSQLPLTRKVAF